MPNSNICSNGDLTSESLGAIPPEIGFIQGDVAFAAQHAHVCNEGSFMLTESFLIKEIL